MADYTERTDIPTMYDGERVLQRADGSLVVVVVREVASAVAERLAFAADCWEVDATGAPTGLSAPRATFSIGRDALAAGDPATPTIDDILAQLTDTSLARLDATRTYRAQAAAVPIRWLAPVVPAAPAVDIPHPLDASADTIAADLAALDTSTGSTSSSS